MLKHKMLMSRLMMRSSSITQSCPTLYDTMDCSTPGFPVHHQLPELAQLMSVESVMPTNHLILCCPLLLLPSTFPSISVFSNESTIHIRWPEYWRFIFSPSNEYSGLISFSFLDKEQILSTILSLLVLSILFHVDALNVYVNASV